MKSLIIYTDGHRFYADDLIHLNEAIQEAASALAASYANGATYLTNSSVVASGGSMVVQAGSMVYKGEICLFDAQTIPVVTGQTLAWVPAVSYRSSDPVVYGNGSSKSPHKIKKVQLQYYDPLTPPADYVDASAVKRGYKSDWITLAPSNGWVASNVAYRLNGDKIEFRGRLTAPTPIISEFFTLPVGYRPSQDRVVPMTGAAASAFSTPLSVSSAGVMSVDTSEVTDANYVYLDGVSFYL